MEHSFGVDRFKTKRASDKNGGVEVSVRERVCKTQAVPRNTVAEIRKIILTYLTCFNRFAFAIAEKPVALVIKSGEYPSVKDRYRMAGSKSLNSGAFRNPCNI